MTENNETTEPEKATALGVQNERVVTRLYRFYNIELSAHGEPFAMCDECSQNYRSPEGCYLEKIADNADWQCDCGA